MGFLAVNVIAGMFLLAYASTSVAVSVRHLLPTTCRRMESGVLASSMTERVTLQDFTYVPHVHEHLVCASSANRVKADFVSLGPFSQ
jgi:hypothetical protein